MPIAKPPVEDDPNPAHFPYKMQTVKDSFRKRLARDFAGMFEIRYHFATAQAWEVWTLIALMGCGAVLRFWGVGSWGLGGDEKTMALPTMHLVHFGLPLMPSGMFYGRAIGQLYLMAASVQAFGQSEWALRFPSVVCGILVIGLTYFVGRRFLAPAWNLAFVASIAFLPALIGDSQEARMYIFLVACLAGYLALLFQWERSGRARYLVAAVLTMVLGIQFHTLAVFGSFLVFFPGMLHGDLRKLIQGAVAFVVMACSFALINAWVQGLYPPRVDLYGLQAVADSRLSTLLAAQLRPVPLLLGVIGSALLAWLVARHIKPRSAAFAVGALFVIGTLFELGLFFHVGLILIVACAIVARRNGVRSIATGVLIIATGLILAVCQFVRLQQLGFGSARKVVGIMAGLPSVWTYLRSLNYSPGAWLVVFLALLQALWLIAQRKRVPDYWLFFALGVWLPLFGLGFFGWYVEVRYTEFALLPLLICAFAIFQGWVGHATPGERRDTVTAFGALAIVLATLLIVNPAATARSVNAGYSIHPDHKGAAEYIESLSLRASDVIVAEDSLEQTYYLGHIDYWLAGQDVALQFVERKHGVLRDIYTGAPLIGTGAELEALVRRRDRGAIYVIGSGEGQEDERRFVRGAGIFETLQKPIFKPIFRGRDGLTLIWKVSEPVPMDAPSGVVPGR
jgi:Dolichyl-phosphate-mannose-protein mannosyltransferase